VLGDVGPRCGAVPETAFDNPRSATVIVITTGGFLEAQHYGIVSYRAKRITTVAPARPLMLLMIFHRRPHSCEVAHVETKIQRVGFFAADWSLDNCTFNGR
jgi:hypothetical protein